MPCYNTRNFWQIHGNKLFGAMYDLSVIMFISTWTTSKNNDKILSFFAAQSSSTKNCRGSFLSHLINDAVHDMKLIKKESKKKK